MSTDFMTKNPIICVDFDGVIHSYASGWKGADVIPDPPVEGAIDWLMEHLPIPEPISAMGPEYKGPEVVIYSARSSQRGGIKAMKEWFVKHGLPPSYISEGILKFPETKPAAFLTLDDRAICFTGKFPTSAEMLNFTTWQKKDVSGNPVFGATGQFPDGKLVHEDEGELQFGIAHDQDNVILNFGKEVAWLAMPPALAKQLGEHLIKHASQIRP